MAEDVMTLDRHIELTPGIRGGKPCIDGTRISVDDIVLMHFRMGQSLEQISGKYGLSLASGHAALAYYDHQHEIDDRIEDDQAFVEAFRRDNPSPLQEKLRGLSLDPSTPVSA